MKKLDSHARFEMRMHAATGGENHSGESLPSDVFVMQQIFAGKWRLPVLIELLKGVQRLSELQRAIPEGTKKMLIDTLRSLETLNWVSKHEICIGGRRVEYSLTKAIRPQLVRLIEPIHTK